MEGQQDHIQQLEAEKKICKTRITKSRNKMQVLIKSDILGDEVEKIIAEYKLYNNYHAELRAIFKKLLIIFIDSPTDMDPYLDEEHDIRLE